MSQRRIWMMNQSGRTRFGNAWAGLLWAMAASAMAGDWPAFRGLAGNGVALEDKAPLHWGPGKNVRWKTPLPGPGNSSPIVSRGRVFITCAEDEGKKRNLYCFDRRTGEKLWVRTVAFPTVDPTHKYEGRIKPEFRSPNPRNPKEARNPKAETGCRMWEKIVNRGSLATVGVSGFGFLSALGFRVKNAEGRNRLA